MFHFSVSVRDRKDERERFKKCRIDMHSICIVKQSFRKLISLVALKTATYKNINVSILWLKKNINSKFYKEESYLFIFYQFQDILYALVQERNALRRTNKGTSEEIQELEDFKT